MLNELLSFKITYWKLNIKKKLKKIYSTQNKIIYTYIFTFLCNNRLRHVILTKMRSFFFNAL